MSTGEQVVKVDFSNIADYQTYLQNLSSQIEGIIYSLQDVGVKFVEMTDYSKSPPSGPTSEYEVLNRYISEITKVWHATHDMLYAANRYVEYYDNLGVYDQGKLIYDEAAVDNVLSNFENIVYDGEWSTGLDSNTFTFEVWENSILFGVDAIDSDKEQAVRHNQSILDSLNESLSVMKSNVINYTDELRDSSGVYKMNLKPLADGVTVNSILQAFDIENIDYQQLKAETEILGNIGKNIGEKLENNLDQVKKDVTLGLGKNVLRVLNPQYVAAKAFAQTDVGRGFGETILGDIYSIGYLISHPRTWDDAALSTMKAINTMTSPYAFKRRYELGAGIISEIQQTIEEEGFGYVVGEGFALAGEVILTDGVLSETSGLRATSTVTKATEVTEDATKIASVEGKSTLSTVEAGSSLGESFGFGELTPYEYATEYGKYSDELAKYGITEKQYLTSLENSIHNIESKTLTLGKYGAENIIYSDVARANGELYFSMDDWNSLYTAVGVPDDLMFEVFNKPILEYTTDNQMTVHLTHDPNIYTVGEHAGKAYDKELSYLKKKNYIYKKRNDEFYAIPTNK